MWAYIEGVFREELMRCKGSKLKQGDNCGCAQRDGISSLSLVLLGTRFVIVCIWCLLLSDKESNESLDSEELLVDSDDKSDEWQQEHLLSEDHVEVGPRLPRMSLMKKLK